MKSFLVVVFAIGIKAASAVVAVKIFMDLISAKSKIFGKALGMGKGAIDAARKRAEGTNYYQRRQMAKEARQQERRRGNIKDFADRLSGDRRRDVLLRRRAAGGITGQLFNTNQAAQERIRQTAEEQLLKEQREEPNRASQRIRSAGLTGDVSHVRSAATKAGQTITSPTGQKVVVSEAMRQAAINNLAAAGRIKELRALENNDLAYLRKATGDPTFVPTADLSARGPGKAPVTETHQMLDRAYTENRTPISNKAPDLLPDLRGNLDIPFTGLKPGEVSTLDPSTIDQAAAHFATSPSGPSDRQEFIAQFHAALKNPSLRGNIKLKQIDSVVAMLASTPGLDPAMAADILAEQKAASGTP